MKKLHYVSLTLFIMFIQTTKSQIILNSTIAKNEIQKTQQMPKINFQLRYYYYPNLDAYYDDKNSLYVYKNKEGWIKNETIPSNYRGYSLFNNYRVEIRDYYGEKPFEKLENHRSQFPQYVNNKAKKIAEQKTMVMNED